MTVLRRGSGGVKTCTPTQREMLVSDNLGHLV